jgi:hypothetical protein
MAGTRARFGVQRMMEICANEGLVCFFVGAADVRG